MKLNAFFSHALLLLTFTFSMAFFSTDGRAALNASGDHFFDVPLPMAACTDDSIAMPAVSCDSFVSPISNKVWSSTGVYIDSLKNSGGCDSLIYFLLTINQTPDSVTTTVVPVCDSGSVQITGTATHGKLYWYTDTVGGALLDSGGTFNTPYLQNPIKYFVEASAQGCTSVRVGVLAQLKYSTYANMSAFACNDFVSPSGKFIWNQSGAYSDTLINGVGCDSIIAVQLVIFNSTSSTIFPRTCDTYTSPSGRHTYSEAGTYKDTIKNTAGCDSIITINLSIDSVITEVVQNGNVLTAPTSSEYQWLDCSDSSTIGSAFSQTYTPSKNGNYAVILTQNGCIDTSSCYNVTGIGISSVDQTEQIQLFPNPTSGHLIIALNQPVQYLTVSIRNSIYQVVGKYTYSNTKRIDVEILGEKGLYFIEISSPENFNQIYKVIKE